MADGSKWIIHAADNQAKAIVSHLATVMQLKPLPGAEHHLFVMVDEERPPVWEGNDVVCYLRQAMGRDGLCLQLMQLSLFIARDAQNRGGVLLHGALAEWGGQGVILAAPGGTGKTTASERLSSPWHSLCDDETLVVHDTQGRYWAHPWPTWNRFLWEESGGSWDVQHAIPLKGVFFLSQGPEEQVEPIGSGQAVSLLVESAQQASSLMLQNLGREEIRMLRLQLFDNLCSLARTIPAYLLHLSLTGSFWQEIEQMLASHHLENNGSLSADSQI